MKGRVNKCLYEEKEVLMAFDLTFLNICIFILHFKFVSIDLFHMHNTFHLKGLFLSLWKTQSALALRAIALFLPKKSGLGLLIHVESKIHC